MLDPSGPMDGYASSITIDLGLYSASVARNDTLASPKLLTVDSDTEKELIAIDLEPISKFVDWEYIGTVDVEF